MIPKDIETFCPSSVTEWRDWLENNHQSKSSIWLVYYKSATKIPSLTWSEAVDQALCFGWIDSTKKTIDEKRYMQYFSQRKPDSIWSKINKNKVVVLLQTQQMKPAGMKSIEVAKQNGSWSRMDDVENLIVPEVLKNEFDRFDGAYRFYQNQSKSTQKLVLGWIALAKREETQLKRAYEIAKAAAENSLPKQLR